MNSTCRAEVREPAARRARGSAADLRARAPGRRRPSGLNGIRRTSAQPRAASRGRLDHLAGVLPEAPQHHRRAGAGDRRADRSQFAGALEQLHRALVQRAGAPAGAGGRRGPRPISVRSERSIPSTSWVAAATFATASAIEIAGRQRRARLGGRHGVVGDHQHRLDPLGRLEPHRRRQLIGAVRRRAEDEPAVERRGDVVRDGPRARPRDGRSRRARCRARTGGRPPPGRRRSPPRSSRGRGRAGCRCGSRTAGRRRNAGARTRARRGSSGRSAGPGPASTENSPVSVTSSSSSSCSAAASTS